MIDQALIETCARAAFAKARNRSPQIFDELSERDKQSYRDAARGILLHLGYRE